MISSVFLHGGGDLPAAREQTFGRFVEAAGPSPAAPLALVIAEAAEADRQEVLAAYREIFSAVGAGSELLAPLFVSPEAPLGAEALAPLRPSGVVVCGGSTPFYHRSLCVERSWLEYLGEAGLPYFGTSAGASVAAGPAILGGWLLERGGVSRAMLFQGAAEGLHALTVEQGLGLVSFAVEGHASQWGTLLRLIHAVESGAAEAGWAIDENTQLELRGGEPTIAGLGHAYHVERRSDTGVIVTVHIAAS